MKPAPAAKSAELQQAVDLDLQERRQQTGEAILLLSQYAQRLYGEGREAYLAIEAGRSSLSITPRIDADESRGINNIVIFCFDLTLAVLAHRHGRGGNGAAALSRAAAGVLRFSEERDPAVLARFVRLRVIDPEGAYWRRGIKAAGRWLRETGNGALRVPYTVVTPEDWGGVGGYPLGQWINEQRRAYGSGTLDAGRVTELEQLGMVWSEQEAAWADGVAVAKQYAAAHGHFLPPVTSTWAGHPIGVWAKNARAAARRARENEELREAGRPVRSAAGAMTQARQDELDAIDPGWCPGWDTEWQRCYRLVQNHVQAGGTLPTTDGDVVVQGEDLGRWVNAQRYGWEQLLLVQQWILENTLKLTPAEEHERPVKQTQDAKWAANLAAARQFHAREGHLRVPRKHAEHLEAAEAVPGRQSGADGAVVVKLGTWLDNVRKRAAKLPEQRRADLDQLGMRW